MSNDPQFEAQFGVPAQRPKVEPTADNRAAAKLLIGLFTALLDEGFTERQAILLLGQMFKAGNTDNDD